MNFQHKVFETTADLRARAAALTAAALQTARTRAPQAADRIAELKKSLATLQVAGRELNNVTRRHVSRFVKQNSTIAMEAGKEVSALARSTYLQLLKPDSAPARKPRKSASRKTAARKRAASLARGRSAAKAG